MPQETDKFLFRMQPGDRQYLIAIAERMRCSQNAALRWMLLSSYARLPDVPRESRTRIEMDIPTRAYMTLRQVAPVKGQLAITDEDEGTDDDHDDT